MGYIFASIQCSSWLVDTVQAATQAQVKEEIAKTYREGDKAVMVHEGGNKAGRFLEVLILAKGGRKGVIWLLEGRFGRGGGDSQVNFDGSWRLRRSRQALRRLGILR